MPIKAENLARYPKDWPQIRARIQQRAGNRCENCGVNNYALGGRAFGGFHKALPLGERMLRLEWPTPGSYSWCEGVNQKLRIIRIVCTTAHLDHIPENCSDDNLRFWCQSCHLSYDAKHHAQTAYATRRKDLAVGDLFSSSEPQSEPTK